MHSRKGLKAVMSYIFQKLALFKLLKYYYPSQYCNSQHIAIQRQARVVCGVVV